MQSEFVYESSLKQNLRIDPLDLLVVAGMASVVMVIAILLGWLMNSVVNLIISGGILGLWVRRKWLGPATRVDGPAKKWRLGMLALSFVGLLSAIYGLSAVHMVVVGGQLTVPPDPMPPLALGIGTLVVGISMLVAGWYGDRQKALAGQL